MPVTNFTAGDVLTAANMNLLPRGKMGGVSVTSAQGSITTITDLTSLTVTFTAVSGRSYRIQADAALSSTETTDVGSVYITDGSNNSVAQRNQVLDTTVGFSLMAVVSPGAGSVTYKLRAARGSGSGTLTLQASAGVPTTIFIEDVGQT